MAGYGTGYPQYFECAKARRHYRRDPREQARLRAGHVTKPTGRTKPTFQDGKGHPRKSWTTWEYECACGHVGWSSHIDLHRQGVALFPDATLYDYREPPALGVDPI